MKVGSKSVLFGVHAFWLHPWFVAEAWSRLYGFPWQPWLWVLFFVHDIGYLGKPNMDGEEGERHPWVGAGILYWLQGWWCYLKRHAWARWEHKDFKSGHGTVTVSRWAVRRRLGSARGSVGSEKPCWGNEALFHSRFLAKRYHTTPSRLCIADKLVITMEPWWLYLPRAIASGEIREYMGLAKTERHGHEHERVRSDVKDSHLAVRIFGQRGRWYLEVQAYMRAWIAEHRDGREDTWTRDTREAQTESGVWT